MIALRAMTPSWPVGSHTQTDQSLVVGGAPAAKHVEVGQGPLLRCSPKANPPRQAALSTNRVCRPSQNVDFHSQHDAPSFHASFFLRSFMRRDIQMAPDT